MTIETDQPMQMKANTRKFPRAWGTYIACFVVALLTALDDADMPYASLLVFLGAPILLLAIPAILLLNLVLLRGYIKQYCWKGCLPLLACLIALPVASFAGDKLIEWRFIFNRDQYEKVAEQIHQRTYSSSSHDEYDIALHREDANLGRSAEAILKDGKVAAVSFLAVSHPFGGLHVRFIRIYGSESWEDGVPMSASHWYRYDY